MQELEIYCNNSIVKFIHSMYHLSPMCLTQSDLTYILLHSCFVSHEIPNTSQFRDASPRYTCIVPQPKPTVSLVEIDLCPHFPWMVVAYIVSVRVRVSADFPSQPFHIFHSPNTSIITRSLSPVKLLYIFFETATANYSRLTDLEYLIELGRRFDCSAILEAVDDVYHPRDENHRL